MAKTKTFNSTALIAACVSIIKPERLHLAELGGDVFVKRHTLAERDSFNQQIQAAEKGDHNAIGVQLATCDEEGNLLFEPSHIEQIKGLPSSVTTEILYKYNVINGYIAPIAEQVEEAKKNS